MPQNFTDLEPKSEAWRTAHIEQADRYLSLAGLLVNGADATRTGKTGPEQARIVSLAKDVAEIARVHYLAAGLPS